MLRIEKYSIGPVTVLCLSGSIQFQNLIELESQVESCTHGLMIDLEEVILVDSAVVRYFSLCESNGVRLHNCPLYIREWIHRENSRERR